MKVSAKENIMDIELSHVTDFESCVDIHLYVSTKNRGGDFEKLFDLSENGRYLVVHARLARSTDGVFASYASISGTIYDSNGEVCIVPSQIFHENDVSEINRWVQEHYEEWNHLISF